METRLIIAAFTVFFCLQSSTASDLESKCSTGFYFKLKTEKCTPCSACAKNQIYLRQCYGTRDTMCATLGNFEFRQKSLGKNAKTEVMFELPKHKEEHTTETSTTLVSEDKWFAVTMVLVGILVFTCVLGVILVFVTCYMCKKKEREIIYDPGMYNST